MKEFKTETKTRANRLDIVRDFGNGYQVGNDQSLTINELSTDKLTKLAKYILELTQEG